MTKLAVLGTGYVGLVTAACLADRGVEVVCVDRDPTRVAAVERGRAPFHEPGLGDLLARTAGKTLRATADLGLAVAGADLVMVAVGTPSGADGIDLRQVREACRGIAAHLSQAAPYPVVVVKSTVVPGTTDEVVIRELESASGRQVGRDLGVAVNPEFLTEGQAVEDFDQPDRIVVGASDSRTAAKVLELYRSFPDAPTLVTTPSTAEMIKYASNTLLATLISFSNEIADLSAAVDGVDVVEVMKGVHASRYLTAVQGEHSWSAPINAFLKAGCGFGGSCLPKDTAALVALGEGLGVSLPLLSSVLDVNARRAAQVVDLVLSGLCEVDNARVAVLGLSFKPDTSDVRESPAFPILRLLHAMGIALVAHDPIAIPEAQAHLELEGIEFEPDLRVALKGADVVVLVTSWPQYEVVPRLLTELDSDALMVDGRRMLDRASVRRYAGVGV